MQLKHSGPLEIYIYTICSNQNTGTDKMERKIKKYVKYQKCNAK